MSRPILAAGAALLFAGHLAAQSISPPIAEYREKARGSFVVTNGTLFPLTVVLTPKGFQVSEDGELTDVPLDTTRIHLKLSAMSFRLQPRQAYTVFYEARADSTPAWFSVWAGITGARTDNGIQLRIELPHVVYLNQKARLPQGDVTITAVRYQPVQQQVVVELRNTGASLGRAKQVTVSAEGVPNRQGAGFPLFPHSTRRTVIPWTDSLPPASVEVRFDGFQLESTGIVTDDGRPPEAPRAVVTTP